MPPSSAGSREHAATLKALRGESSFTPAPPEHGPVALDGTQPSSATTATGLDSQDTPLAYAAGDIFEKGGDVEVAQVAPVRANETTAPRLDHPEKLGAVLNHALETAPTAAELSAAGMRDVRMSLTDRDYANLDRTLPEGTRPDGVRTLKELLESYQREGIQVTANLPPESVEPGYAGEPFDWMNYSSSHPRSKAGSSSTTPTRSATSTA